MLLNLYIRSTLQALITQKSILDTVASAAVVCKGKYTKERTVQLILNACDSLSLRRNSNTDARLAAGRETSSVTERERERERKRERADFLIRKFQEDEKIEERRIW